MALTHKTGVQNTPKGGILGGPQNTELDLPGPKTPQKGVILGVVSMTPTLKTAVFRVPKQVIFWTPPKGVLFHAILWLHGDCTVQALKALIVLYNTFYA